MSAAQVNVRSDAHPPAVLLALPAAFSAVSALYILFRLAWTFIIPSGTSLKAGRVNSTGTTAVPGPDGLVVVESAVLALDGLSILAFRVARLAGILALLSVQIYGLTASNDASSYYCLGVYVCRDRPCRALWLITLCVAIRIYLGRLHRRNGSKMARHYFAATHDCAFIGVYDLPLFGCLAVCIDSRKPIRRSI